MVSSYRYLGVWLDTNLSFKCHVDNLQVDNVVKTAAAAPDSQCSSVTLYSSSQCCH